MIKEHLMITISNKKDFHHLDTLDGLMEPMVVLPAVRIFPQNLRENNLRGVAYLLSDLLIASINSRTSKGFRTYPAAFNFTFFSTR
jgi:hypothetical protein